MPARWRGDAGRSTDRWRVAKIVGWTVGVVKGLERAARTSTEQGAETTEIGDDEGTYRDALAVTMSALRTDSIRDARRTAPRRRRGAAPTTPADLIGKPSIVDTPDVHAAHRALTELSAITDRERRALPSDTLLRMTREILTPDMNALMKSKRRRRPGTLSNLGSPRLSSLALFCRPRPVHRREEGGAAGDAAEHFAAPLFVVDGCPAGAPARRPEKVERGVSEVPAVEVALVPQERRRERVRLVGHALVRHSSRSWVSGDSTRRLVGHASRTAAKLAPKSATSARGTRKSTCAEIKRSGE